MPTDVQDPLTLTFAALADPTRRAMLARLAAGEATVSELAEPFAVSLPAISQHLKVLKEARLVSSTAVGTRRVYALDSQGLAAVRGYFDQFWNHALAAFAQAVEQPPEETP